MFDACGIPRNPRGMEAPQVSGMDNASGAEVSSARSPSRLGGGLCADRLWLRTVPGVRTPAT
jgi:hypothetical protein